MKTVRVISLDSVKDSDNLRITVMVDNGSYHKKKRYEITPADYERLGCPDTDCTLSDYELKILSHSVNSKGAKDAAYRILAHSDNNRFALKRKLIARGFSEDVAKTTVKEMQEKGFINEYSQVCRYVISLANQKLYGENKIIPYLLSRGYERDDIERALSEATENGEIDFEEIKGLLISQNNAKAKTESEIRALLFKHGHDRGSDFS